MNKSKIAILLCLIMMFSSVLSVCAKDDAVGLSYKADIVIYDKNNSLVNTYERGDKIRVDILLNSTGVASAPLYALQGTLSYDIGCLSASSINNSENVLTASNAGVVSFSFLDKSVTGVRVSDSFVIASITFDAIQDGSAKLMFTQFDVTNADTSPRSVDYSAIKEIKVGTGIRIEDKPSLLNLITKCKTELDGVTLSASGESISNNTFWVTPAVYDRFQSVIDESKEVFNNETSSTEDISQAMKNLDVAITEFFANRFYGTKSNHGGNLAVVPVDTKVTVTAVAGEHGKLAEDSLKQLVNKNTSATIVSIPDEGYEVDKVYVNGEEFDGSENFTIPKITNDTAVKVTFRWKNVFTDVKSDDWFYSYVMFANENGIMSGTEIDKFAPNADITRGMFVTVLYRIENEPATDISRFSDVKADMYYGKAVGWASANEIVKGISETEFAPDKNITREQMAAIMYRYAKFKEMDVSGNENLNYSDNESVSDYAKSAVIWSAEKGIMLGNTDGTFAPQKNSTRAEASAVFMRIIEKLK